MRAVPLLVLCLWLLASVESAWVRGVPPHDQSKYQQATFTCFDGTKSIPIAQVNDDYCDCENDGSDEPGTSACAKGKFYCPNKMHVGYSIFSSRVNDGYCDCCDGSDEWKSKTTCVNTCKEQGEHTRKEKLQVLEAYREGLKIKQEYIAKAKERRAEEEKKIEALKAELVTAKAAAAEKEQIYTDNLSNEMAARELVEKYKEPEDEDHLASAERSWDDEDPKEEDGVKAEEKKEEEKKEEEQKKPERPELTEEIKAKLEEARKVLEESKIKKAELDAQKDKVEQIEGDIKEKQDFLALDFGADSAYYPLYNEPLKYKTIEYTYELTPFKSVKQEYTSLGDWVKWVDNGKKMRYDNGASCWGVSYRRNCEVSVECGKENKILEVNEPNKCEYTMRLATPAACEAAHLAMLEDEYRKLTADDVDIEGGLRLDTKDIL